MTRATRRLTVVPTTALILTIGLPTRIDSARWWQSARFVNRLALSSAQQSAIDRIYERDLPQRRAAARDAWLTHARFQQLLEANAPEDVLVDAASRAVDADAARRRLRTMMLYRMSLILTPQQRSRFAALAQQRGVTLP